MVRIALIVRIALAAAALPGVTAPAIAAPDPTWVVLGDGGAASLRVATASPGCPVATIDGRPVPMHVRAAASTEPQRPTESDPERSKPSSFAVTVCETAGPAGARMASIEGRRLPLPRARLDRLVVIGDTGCRLKAKDEAWQACSDPAEWPFARIAAKVAAWKPDAVIHVGDFLYRENPCEGHAGCAGTPWGYGWDAWDADWFAPARPLLEAAPLILARGNHESCTRAGQGWWRLLDPRPLVPGRDCNDPANDAVGNVSPAYAVPLGGRAQVVVLDLAGLGTKKLKAGDPRIAAYQADWRATKRLAAGARFTFALDHYPILGVAAKEKGPGEEDIKFTAGSKALASAWQPLDAAVVPPGVDVLLAGHIHAFEWVDFAGRRPPQFIAGISGTQEDPGPLPHKLPAGITPAPGVPVAGFDAIVGKFGWMTLERTGPVSWSAQVWGLDGALMERCRIRGPRSTCRRG